MRRPSSRLDSDLEKWSLLVLEKCPLFLATACLYSLNLSTLEWLDGFFVIYKIYLYFESDCCNFQCFIVIIICNYIPSRFTARYSLPSLSHPPSGTQNLPSRQRTWCNWRSLASLYRKDVAFGKALSFLISHERKTKRYII